MHYTIEMTDVRDPMMVVSVNAQFTDEAEALRIAEILARYVPCPDEIVEDMWCVAVFTWDDDARLIAQRTYHRDGSHISHTF